MTCHGNQFALLGKLTCVKLFFYVFLWLCFEEPTVVHWLTKLAELYLVSTIYSSAHCGSATEPLIHYFSAMGLSLAASFVRVSVFIIFVLHMCIYIIYTCNYIYFFPSSWTPISCSIRGGFGNLLGKGSKMPCRPFHVKTPSLFPGSSKPNKLASHGGVFFLLDLACASWLLQVMWLFPSY
jgi:hypothetical protein